MTNKIEFPQDFVWGAATSSYQIEGGWQADGKGESIWDRFSHTPGKIKDGDTGDVACDHFHRYAEDIRIMQEIGLQAYRFSISWPRVLPQGRGHVNEAGLDFYDRLVDGLLEAGIKPFVTLYHWDLPQALEDNGGWPARSTAEAFVEYADVVSARLGDRVKNWITHNEPAVTAWAGYLNGDHAPGHCSLNMAIRTSHHLLLSHGWAVPIIRQNSPGCEVGITLNAHWVVAASNSRADLDIARQDEGQWFRWFIDPLYARSYPPDILADFAARRAWENAPHSGISQDFMELDFVRAGDMPAIATPTDFLGLNYYFRSIKRSPEPENEPQTVFPAPPGPENYTEMGWENHPQGLTAILGRLYFDYQMPKLYITENGASYSTPPDATGRVPDVHRVTYLRKHLAASHRAILAGIPLAGYFAWSLFDNFEWAFGYSQRFGLVWVDFESQQRVLKDSALWYRKIIEANGLEI